MVKLWFESCFEPRFQNETFLCEAKKGGMKRKTIRKRRKWRGEWEVIYPHSKPYPSINLEEMTIHVHQ